MMPVTYRAGHFERHWKTPLCDKTVILVLRDPEKEAHSKYHNEGIPYMCGRT